MVSPDTLATAVMWWNQAKLGFVSLNMRIDIDRFIFDTFITDGHRSKAKCWIYYHIALLLTSHDLVEKYTNLNFLIFLLRESNRDL